MYISVDGALEIIMNADISGAGEVHLLWSLLQQFFTSHDMTFYNLVFLGDQKLAPSEPIIISNVSLRWQKTEYILKMENEQYWYTDYPRLFVCSSKAVSKPQKVAIYVQIYVNS